MDENRRWYIVGICSLLFFLSMFYRVSSAVISPQLIDEFGLSSDELGLLAAAFFYTFALFQIPLGLLMDRFGARITMSVFSIIGGIGAIVFAKSGGINGLLLGRALLGAGMACNLMGSMKLFTEWFRPHEFATLSGSILAVGTVGNMMATSPLVLMMGSIGWRASFVAIAIITIFLSVCFFMVVRDKPEEPASGLYPNKIIKIKTPLFASIKTVFLDPNYWAISGSTFLRYGTFAAVQALWASPFLLTILHISPLATGNLLFILNIGFLAGSPIGGFLSDRIDRSRKKTVIIGLILMAIAFLAVAFYRHNNLIWLGLIFFIMGFGSSFGQVMYAHIKELMPPHMSGTAMTGINLFTMMGAAVFLHGFGKILNIQLFGALSASAGYGIAFFMCFIGILIAVALYSKTKDSIVQK